MMCHIKDYENLRLMMETDEKLDKSIQHVETFVASHRNHFEHPIASQSQVNYVQCVYRAQPCITFTSSEINNV